MDFTLTEEQQMMRQMVRDFAKNEIEPWIPRMEDGEFPRELLEKMGELGLMGITAPEQYGGSEMDFLSYIIAIHELSKVSAVMGVVLSVHTSVGMNPILYFGTEEQKKRYLPKMASGSDAGSLKTKAKRVDDHYVINGSKMFITNGGEADVYIVFANTAPEKGTYGITAFIVDRDTPGLSIGKDEKKMGLHGSRTVALSFDNMKVPVENRLGEEGGGFKIAMANLDVGRIGIAAQALGIAEASLEAAVAYAKEREQFGKPIAANQGVGFKLADMATATEAARLLVYRAAWLRSEGKPCGKEASMAKLFASQASVDNSIEAVQVFGGYGYTKDYPVERYFRDAKVCQIYEGTSEIQKVVIAKHLTN
ncbi:acyl-CoA dehydrogenase [Sporosarcina ureae]|uniref:Acyl-CoA dehydrogenase n=1 Tax=Sporosarcina ureae TaxID=1571 RepID=A0ABM6JX71_SPOUR|nr:acyl-CoA dehydrogenase [Sporosarcina ureae]ARF14831.1 acyl-CoA dehydrogenase [Sporosarcina ureae]